MSEQAPESFTDEFTPNFEPQSEVGQSEPGQSEPGQPAEQGRGAGRKRTPARRGRRPKTVAVDAATVALVLSTHERVRKAGVEVREAAARALKVAAEQEALTVAVLGGDDTVAKALADLSGLPRNNFEQAMVGLAEWESADRVRAAWATLGAVTGNAGKLPADGVLAAIQVARTIAEVPAGDWSRIDRVAELLEG